MRFLRQSRRAGAPAQFIVAERFASRTRNLSGVSVPMDVVAAASHSRVRFLIASESNPQSWRMCTVAEPRFESWESVRLDFHPFSSAPGDVFHLGVAAAPFAEDRALELAALSDACDTRTPITLDTRGDGNAGDLLLDVNGMAARRIQRQTLSGLPVSTGIDGFWCDTIGTYLRGWIQMSGRTIRGLTVISDSRHVTVRELRRRDAQEDVIEFTVYLEGRVCDAVLLLIETDEGRESVTLALPDGPLPRWEQETSLESVPPPLRLFADMANSSGGIVLHVGSRTAAGMSPVPEHDLFTGRVVGIDIHPGYHVDLVGDAHRLSHFIRAGSVNAVCTASVLEHLHAPWAFAYEVNRVLQPGGVVYHCVPSTWPAHAQPNDFWRMSSDGLRTLFGPATGFEVLGAKDSGLASIHPREGWRTDQFIEMPMAPAYALAEIVARKVAEVEPGAVAWPLPDANSARSQAYPVEGLREVPREVTR